MADALTRWRDRCSDACICGTGLEKRGQRAGMVAALSLALYSLKASEVETNLTEAIRSREELSLGREQRAMAPGLRLALRWLQEEAERDAHLQA